ncbi:hypothetical protein BC629DRAFT_1596659 [Irpex lacteus]|nr:hypothetical protein BC629DRAFT_1596659 [Irpex lacteus]
MELSDTLVTPRLVKAYLNTDSQNPEPYTTAHPPGSSYRRPAGRVHGAKRGRRRGGFATRWLRAIALQQTFVLRKVFAQHPVPSSTAHSPRHSSTVDRRCNAVSFDRSAMDCRPASRVNGVSLSYVPSRISGHSCQSELLLPPRTFQDPSAPSFRDELVRQTWCRRRLRRFATDRRPASGGHRPASSSSRRRVVELTNRRGQGPTPPTTVHPPASSSPVVTRRIDTTDVDFVIPL